MKITMEAKIIINITLKSDKDQKLQIAIATEQCLNSLGVMEIEGQERLLRFHIDDVSIS